MSHAFVVEIVEDSTGPSGEFEVSSESSEGQEFTGTQRVTERRLFAFAPFEGLSAKTRQRPLLNALGNAGPNPVSAQGQTSLARLSTVWLIDFNFRRRTPPIHLHERATMCCLR
ncbi:MAG: hypothetical protein JWN70_5888 [Planctomycetaceae bacterium]|nr:hypothetical protein [Planctomycetaceae bacterium]